MATTRKLLGMHNATPLTARDAWSGTFEHTLAARAQAGKGPRVDCPLHLPAAPPRSLHPADEARLPLNSLQREIAEVRRMPIHATNQPHS